MGAAVSVALPGDSALRDPGGSRAGAFDRSAWGVDWFEERGSFPGFSGLRVTQSVEERLVLGGF